MNRFSRLLALLMSLCLMVSLLASCGGNTDSGGSTADAGKDTFTVALDSDIVKLDPAFAYDFTTNPVVNQITQGLLTFDEDNQLQPMLASSWEQKDDLTYVYQIRDDVTFSDGSAMTMDDVLYSMNRIKDPATASYLSWMYDNVASIEQTGDWELTVTLSTPDATWQYVPATTAGHVISKAYAEQVGDKLGTPEGGLVGTGPYKYVSWQNGSSVQLTRNENYWNKDDAPYFDNLTFKIITEDTTRVTALQTGDVDCTVAPPESMLDVLKGDQNLTLTSSPGFGVSFVAFNTQKEPFNNVKVRQAIYDAIDLDTIQSSLIKDAGEASTALPSSTALFTIETDRWNDYLSKAPKHTYDVEAAKALLAEAGYPDGFTCSLMIADSSLRNSMALAIQEQLAQIGINVTIKQEDSATQRDEIGAGTVAPLFLQGLGGPYCDINLIASIGFTEGARYCTWVSPEFMDLASQAASEMDAEKRVALYSQMQQMMVDEAPALWLYQQDTLYAYNSKKVQNWTARTDEVVLMDGVSVAG